jgi:hypothetical protein
MKNKLIYGVYIFVSLVVILLAYNWYGSTQRATASKSLKSLNTKSIKMYQEEFDTNRSFGYLWGIKNAEKKSDVNITQAMKNQNDENSTELLVTQEKSKLCIDKKCYRFVGIYHKAGVAYISFYSKEFKKGLQDFRLNQTLDKTLYIKKIKHNRLFLADKNSTREWQFHLFDVNATKYKPKDNNETDF